MIAIPAAIALGLCLYEISNRSLWLDEAASVSIASQHGGALGAALARDGGNMLGYYALLHVLVGLFGTGAVAIRIASALGAAVAVALLGLLALRLFGRRTALLAGLLAAVSLTMVYWGQNARAYSLMLALICGSFVSLVWLLGSRTGAWRPWLAYVVLTTAAAYWSLEAILVLPAQLVVLGWHRDRARAVLSAMAVAALCCIPLAVLAAERGGGQLFWVPAPSFKTLKRVVESLSSSALEPNLYTGSARFLAFLTLALVLAAAARVGYAWRSRRERAQAWRPTMVLAWLILPLAAVAIISELSQSIFQPRYLLISLPAVSLLLAWLLDGIWQAGRRSRGATALARRLSLGILSVGLLAALVTLRWLQVAPSYGKSTEPWNQVTRYVSAAARPGDCLAFYPLDVRMPFRYYLRSPGAAPRPVLPNLPWNQVRAYVEEYSIPSRAQLVATTAGCRRLWLVASHAGETDGTRVSQAHLHQYFVLVNRLHRTYPNVRGAAFGYAGLITVTLMSA